MKTGWKVGIALGVLVAGSAAFAADPEVKSDEQKTLYALGAALSRNVASFSLTGDELELVKLGLTDAVLNREKKVNVDEFMPKIQSLAKTRAAALSEAEEKTGAAYREKAAQEKGAVKTDSGLIYFETKAGSGDAPKPTDKVKVHYKGTLIDGTEFDSSFKRNEPATFPLNGVIPCWTEGLQKMKPGGKGKLVCPAKIAYGDRGAPPLIKPGSTLVFEVELLEIMKNDPPAAPPAAAPKPSPAAK